MSNRTRHNAEIPTIARAIQEYKTTTKTQPECAKEFGIPIKVFSYYYLNGFKKNQRVGGGLIPDETPHQRKSKNRDNNYEVVLVGAGNQSKPISHTPPQPSTQSTKPISHTPQSPPQPSPQPTKPISKPVIKNDQKQIINNASIAHKINNATTVSKTGKVHVDLSQFL